MHHILASALCVFAILAKLWSIRKAPVSRQKKRKTTVLQLMVFNFSSRVLLWGRGHLKLLVGLGVCVYRNSSNNYEHCFTNGTRSQTVVRKRYGRQLFDSLQFNTTQREFSFCPEVSLRIQIETVWRGWASFLLGCILSLLCRCFWRTTGRNKLKFSSRESRAPLASVKSS